MHERINYLLLFRLRITRNILSLNRGLVVMSSIISNISRLTTAGVPLKNKCRYFVPLPLLRDELGLSQ